ncbi:hypothetical protein IscW_ISCW013144 [Ixodes scapularis]|uniref:Uncharacterized protein n=1 Tax=Ixodes scapularis TaxID=6945 RepID=B7QF58_IXOSC|nr:hypothetical protein IscW_ISCW013144 [Ixodes scapularis]|eukprot:XP_002414172.1 hypothetical protein IscW_ISCW013144 [Ixodes scapularis]
MLAVIITPSRLHAKRTASGIYESSNRAAGLRLLTMENAACDFYYPEIASNF